MSTWTTDTGFQISRIRTIIKHFEVVVCLNDKIIGIMNNLLHIVGEMTAISNYRERDTTSPYDITHIVGTVMWNTEGRNVKLTNLQSFPFFDNAFQSRVNFLSNTRIVHYSLMNEFRSVDWNIIM